MESTRYKSRDMVLAHKPDMDTLHKIAYPAINKKMFINTGCWVKLSKNCIEKENAIPNTFLYIETKALYLLKWNEEVKEEEKNITCVKDFREVLSQ